MQNEMTKLYSKIRMEISSLIKNNFKIILRKVGGKENSKKTHHNILLLLKT